MFLFQFFSKVLVLISLFAFPSFTRSAGTAKSNFRQDPFFLLTITWCGRLIIIIFIITPFRIVLRSARILRSVLETWGDLLSLQRESIIFARVRVSKSLQVSRTLLSILADLNNTVVWMVSTCSFITKSSKIYTNPLVTLSKVKIIIGIDVIFLFYNFINSWARSWYLSFFSLSFHFTLWSAETTKFTIRQVLFLLLLLLTITRSNRLAEISLSVFISKSQRNLYVSFSRADSGLCIYLLFICSNFIFLHIRLLCEGSFRLNHHITCFCFFCWLLTWFDIIIIIIIT